MELMLTRLSADHFSKAASTSFSASEALTGRVDLRMSFQTLRVWDSRWIREFPCSIDLRSLANSSERFFQLSMSGLNASRSSANSATMAIAIMARRRWRISIFMFQSIVPLEVKCELQRGVATDLIDAQVVDLLRTAQTVNSLEQGCVIPRCAGTANRIAIVAIANLDDFGRNNPVFRKCFG